VRRPRALCGLRQLIVLSLGLGLCLATQPATARSFGGFDAATKSAASTGSLPHYASLAYDPAVRAVVLFGGLRNCSTASCDVNQGSVSDETWVWDGQTWTRQYPASSPPPRFNATLAYDPRNQTVVLFGGSQSGVPIDLDDTWLWDGQTWTEQFPGTTPPSSSSATLVYDAATDSVVLVGAGPQSDLWTWNGQDWTAVVSPQNPPSRQATGVAYDAARGVIVLFGGATHTSDPVPGAGVCCATDTLGDTWLWDGRTWTEATAGAGPPPRSGARMAYDAARGVVVLFGGNYNQGPRQGIPLNDTWTWNGSAWLQQQVDSSPPAKNGAAMTYDFAGEAVILVGADPADTLWSWDGAAWSPNT
jgi:hypothetical protein